MCYTVLRNNCGKKHPPRLGQYLLFAQHWVLNLVSLYSFLTHSGRINFQIAELPDITVSVYSDSQVAFGSGTLILIDRVRWALISVQLFLGDSLIVLELFYLLILFPNFLTGIPHVCRVVS